MSRVWLISGALISVLCMKAAAGWVVDGTKVGGDAESVAEQVAVNAAAIAVLETGKQDRGESIAMPMDDAAGTNSKWSEWAVGEQSNTNGNWRLGVVNSNFVIQVYQAGSWSNAVMFLKP